MFNIREVNQKLYLTLNEITFFFFKYIQLSSGINIIYGTQGYTNTVLVKVGTVVKYSCNITPKVLTVQLWPNV